MQGILALITCNNGSLQYEIMATAVILHIGLCFTFGSTWDHYKSAEKIESVFVEFYIVLNCFERSSSFFGRFIV